MTYTYHISSKSQYHQFNICDRYHNILHENNIKYHTYDLQIEI